MAYFPLQVVAELDNNETIVGLCLLTSPPTGGG